MRSLMEIFSAAVHPGPFFSETRHGIAQKSGYAMSTPTLLLSSIYTLCLGLFIALKSNKGFNLGEIAS